MNKAGFQSNIVLNYILYTIIILALGTGVMVYVVSDIFETYILESHISIYPEIMEVIIDSNPQIKDYFLQTDISAQSKSGEELFSPLLKIGKVFRIKIWNSQGMVLWSDEPNNIGTYTVPDASFTQALNGTAVYSVQEPQIGENDYEGNKGILLEIYAPVKTGNQTLGIIEFYESTQELADTIKKGKMAIILTGVSVGLGLYLLQFSIFYRSHKNQLKLSLQLVHAKDSTLFALASLAENRDEDTAKHLERTSEYVHLLVTKLSEDSSYKKQINAQFIEEIVKAAPLHDIGKVGIRDAILLKPGPLTTEEFDMMKTHTEIGAKTLRGADHKLNEASYLTRAIEIVHCHHEKWNGEGYPNGYAGEEIPLSARIMAVADVYDALRSQRPYKPSFDHEKACDIMLKDTGTHFDPEIMKIFSANSDQMKAIFDAHLE